MPSHLITQAELKEILHYDPETGLFTCKTQRAKRTKIGSIAGTTTPKGYIVINCKGRGYMAHILAVVYMTGEHPSTQIDHINRVRDDNRWENIRITKNGSADNSQNRKIRSDSTTGFQGVYRKAHGKSRPWASTICVKGKVTHIGCFATPEEAHAAYLRKKRDLHPFFAG